MNTQLITKVKPVTVKAAVSPRKHSALMPAHTELMGTQSETVVRDAPLNW